MDIVSLFDTLPGENAPRHLPTDGTVYKYTWTDDNYSDDWRADGYRSRNQGTGKRVLKYDEVGLLKTFFHVSFVSFFLFI